MSNILGIKHYVKADGSESIVVAYGNDIGIFDGVSTFTGQGRNLAVTEMEFDVSLDFLLGVNGSNPNLMYDGSSWHAGGSGRRMPVANYVKTVGAKTYLVDLSYANKNFRSRIWYSGLPKNELIVWGYETGTNLVQTQGSKIITSVGAMFSTLGIKTGDPFFITTGGNAGQYTVDTIDFETQITLFEEMKNTATGSTYWVGSNWLDVRTNDGDILRGIGENDNKVLLFKRDSLFKYDERELRRVKGVPGTTSHRSIVNVRENTYYFHDTGIWRYDGVTSFLVSRPIQDWIDGISVSDFPNVVGWADEDLIYWAIGDIVNADKDINITNGVLILDTAAQAWSIGKFAQKITCTTTAVETNARNVYLGTTTDEVLTWHSGNAHISAPIEFQADTVFHFPGQAYNVVEFVKCEVYTLSGRGISVYYKLFGTNKIDTEWRPLGDINNDVTELVFPRGTYGRGVAYRFSEISTRVPILLGRIDTYYKDREARNLPSEVAQ